jgi:hypothetical protein
VVKYSFGQKKRTKKCEELLISNFKMKRPQLDIFDEDVSFDDVTDTEIKAAEYDVKLKREKELEQQSKIVKENANPRRSDAEQGDLFS